MHGAGPGVVHTILVDCVSVVALLSFAQLDGNLCGNDFYFLFLGIRLLASHWIKSRNRIVPSYSYQYHKYMKLLVATLKRICAAPVTHSTNKRQLSLL